MRSSADPPTTYFLDNVSENLKCIRYLSLRHVIDLTCVLTTCSLTFEVEPLRSVSISFPKTLSIFVMSIRPLLLMKKRRGLSNVLPLWLNWTNPCPWKACCPSNTRKSKCAVKQTVPYILLRILRLHFVQRVVLMWFWVPQDLHGRRVRSPPLRPWLLRALLCTALTGLAACLACEVQSTWNSVWEQVDEEISLLRSSTWVFFRCNLE